MAKSSYELTNLVQKLKSALAYNPDTGEFIWRTRLNAYYVSAGKGAVAGTSVLDRDGGTHINISFEGKLYRAHRLAYLFMKGKWPSGDIDHKDGVRTHNWWTNLRPASRGQNNANRHKLMPNNVSGKTGISWVARLNKWLARINVDGKVIHLGIFDKDKLQDAVKVRRAAELKYWGAYAPDSDTFKMPSLRGLKNAKPKPHLSPRNKSGKTGVFWDTRERAWSARITVKGRQIHLGFFPKDKLQDAVAARRKAEKKYLGKYLPT